MEEAIFSQHTIDFVKTALEYCNFVESAKKYEKTVFIDRASKILPLLYLNVSLIPESDEFYDSYLENGILEDRYIHMMTEISHVLGEDDLYLETFHPDIQLSDSPVAVKISEDMADIYQDLGNFIYVFQHGQKDTMHDSLFLCIQNFKEYWGQKLVNALRAIHNIKYREQEYWTDLTSL
jgi:hypothetical protein